MKKLTSITLFLFIFSFPAFAAQNPEGTLSVASPYSVQETTDRLETIILKKGMKIFNRINHAEGAKMVEIPIRDTELLIFGNPKVGAPLMQCTQTIGLDLPMKALVWQNEQGQVFITYNDIAYLKHRHDLQGCESVIEKVTAALAGITNAAVQ